MPFTSSLAVCCIISQPLSYSALISSFEIMKVFGDIIRNIIGVSKNFILASFWPASLSFLTFNFIGFWRNFRFHRETCCMCWIIQIVVKFATLKTMLFLRINFNNKTAKITVYNFGLKLLNRLKKTLMMQWRLERFRLKWVEWSMERLGLISGQISSIRGEVSMIIGDI